MPKKSVKSFSVELKTDHVLVEIETENMKPYRYKIREDDNHPDLIVIAEHLQKGLTEAKSTYKKIEVVEFFERMYVTISTPLPGLDNRYTASKA